MILVTEEIHLEIVMIKLNNKIKKLNKKKIYNHQMISSTKVESMKIKNILAKTSQKFLMMKIQNLKTQIQFRAYRSQMKAYLTFAKLSKFYQIHILVKKSRRLVILFFINQNQYCHQIKHLIYQLLIHSGPEFRNIQRSFITLISTQEKFMYLSQKKNILNHKI